MHYTAMIKKLQISIMGLTLNQMILFLVEFRERVDCQKLSVGTVRKQNNPQGFHQNLKV
jgi:hypothetical protein